MSTRPIFRASAVEAYRRGLERANVPRLIAWPSTLFFWVLLAAFLIAALVAWSVHVPTYASASGAIVAGVPASSPTTTTAVLFLGPGRADRMRRGQRVHLSLGSSGAYVDGVVAGVVPGVIGPTAAGQRYGVSGLISQPSAAVAIRLSRALPTRVYGGSRVSARVEIASERIISLLTG